MISNILRSIFPSIAACSITVFNKLIVCEGVETKEMVDFLVQEDCDELQGYYYYKPLEMQKFEALIA